MPDDPIGQGTLESNIASRFFGLNPLVFENLFTLSLEFPVKRGILKQIIGRERLFRLVRHSRIHKNVLCREV